MGRNNAGEDVDLWNMNDLETLVDLFKRNCDKPGAYSYFKMQEIDIDVEAANLGQ